VRRAQWSKPVFAGDDTAGATDKDVRAAAAMDGKPALVIWQAGTADPDDQGVEMLRAQGAYVETR